MDLNSNNECHNIYSITGMATKPLFGLTIKDNMIDVPRGTVPDIN